MSRHPDLDSRREQSQCHTLAFKKITMPTFSQRHGYKKLQKSLQRETVDEELRSRMWTLLKLFVWDRWNRNYYYASDTKEVEALWNQFWFRYFKKPSDERPTDCYNILRQYFFTCTWYEVYDFIEFIFSQLSNRFLEKLRNELNNTLTEENSAYRLVSDQFVEITSDTEIDSLEQAVSTPFSGVNTHMEAAISFLSDRKTPDYRNSIKESISAIESLFKIICKKKSATLSEGLKTFSNSIEIHPALLKGFEKIYAYTSDNDGVRHAIFDAPTATFNDAKFMAVSCSAFITYVIGKCAEYDHKI